MRLSAIDVTLIQVQVNVWLQLRSNALLKLLLQRNIEMH